MGNGNQSSWCTIQRRALSESERTLLRSRAKFHIVEILFGIFFFLLGPVILGHLLYSLIGWSRGGPQPKWMFWAIAGVLVLTGIRIIVMFTKYSVPRHRLARLDLEHGQAEIVHVKTPKVAEVLPRESEGPRFFFDLGDRRLLYMGGQWLDAAHTYGLESILDTGRPFPASEFELQRAPRSGIPFAITVLGERLEPVMKYEPETISCPQSQTAVLQTEFDSLGDTKDRP